MLYTIRQLPGEPIFLVRALPPLHPHKRIHSIDYELLRMTQGFPGKVYRIDDLTRLHPHQFTYSDAVQWFTGPIREDACWRASMEHIAVGKRSLRHVLPRLARDHELHVPLFPSMPLALSYTRLKITSRNTRGE